MFHMLSCFDLDTCSEVEGFRADYLEFFAKMRSLDLVESAGPIGRRQSDTGMDADDERQHEYFVIMSFRDRKQVDAGYAYIAAPRKPENAIHKSMHSKVRNPIFICWQDLE
jgi:hypothetical protein